MTRSWMVALALSSLGVAGCVGTIDGEAPLPSGAADAGGPPTGDVGDNTPPATPDAAVAPDAAQDADPPATFDVTGVSRDSTLSIARASVGYTYWWGHGGFGGTKAGTCEGSCPSCTHSGPQGADCSGFVGKAWMLPEAMPIVANDSHPFSTYNFRFETEHWSPISRDDVIAGDAMVHRDNGAGHIFLYEKDDPWGDMWAYEARGCAYGVVHDIRSAGSTYIAIRREGF